MSDLGKLGEKVRGIAVDVRRLEERRRLDASVRALELELGLREWDERDERELHERLDPFSSPFLQELRGKIARDFLAERRRPSGGTLNERSDECDT